LFEISESDYENDEKEEEIKEKDKKPKI